METNSATKENVVHARMEMGNPNDWVHFDYEKLKKYTHEDYKALIFCICDISTILCMHQCQTIERIYHLASIECQIIKSKKYIFDDAIEICKDEGIITCINPKGLAYQTNSLHYPIKQDAELRKIAGY